MARLKLTPEKNRIAKAKYKEKHGPTYQANYGKLFNREELLKFFTEEELLEDYGDYTFETIVSTPYNAYVFAVYTIKGRYKKIEPIIYKSPIIWKKYEKFLKEISITLLNGDKPAYKGRYEDT